RRSTQPAKTSAPRKKNSNPAAVGSNRYGNQLGGSYGCRQRSQRKSTSAALRFSLGQTQRTVGQNSFVQRAAVLSGRDGKNEVADEYAGVFVAAALEHLRSAGVASGDFGSVGAVYRHGRRGDRIRSQRHGESPERQSSIQRAQLCRSQTSYRRAGRRSH